MDLKRGIPERGGIFHLDDDLAPEFFALGTAAQDADDHLLYNKVTGQLFYDTDGAGGVDAILLAVLTNHADLTAADFMLL